MTLSRGTTSERSESIVPELQVRLTTLSQISTEVERDLPCAQAGSSTVAKRSGYALLVCVANIQSCGTLVSHHTWKVKVEEDHTAERVALKRHHHSMSCTKSDSHLGVGGKFRYMHPRTAV